MNADEQAALVRLRSFFRRQLVGPHAALVLEDVIHVLVLQPPQPQAIEPPVSQLDEIPADLKIDQVRAIVLAEQNILRLVRVDIRDSAAVNLAQQVLQLRKESVRN